MNKVYHFLFFCLFLMCCSRDYPRQDIVILFNSHSTQSLMGYGALRYVKDSLRNETPFVSLVSCGNFANKNACGTISRGEAMVDLMNSVEYNVVSLGNSDFDFGVEQTNRLASRLKAKVVCCNYSKTNTNKLVKKGYYISEFGDTKVAFIGVIHPKVVAAHPQYTFMDKMGEQMYSFNDGELYDLVQRTVNHARMRNVDYVIVLSDLGADAQNDIFNNEELIARTYGIDAVISQSEADMPLVTDLPNKKGRKVILASSDNRFNSIGELVIKKKQAPVVNFIPMSDLPPSPKLVKKITAMMKEKNIKLDEYVGYNQLPLFNKRAVSDSSLVVFAAEALREMTHSDIAIISGEDLGQGLDSGIIRYEAIHACCPSQYSVARLEMKGKTLMDNFSSEAITGEQRICISGIKNDIIPMQIFHKNEWQPLDTNKTYTLVTYGRAFSSKSPLFKNFKSLRNINEDNAELLVDYIAEIGDTIRSIDFAHPATAFFLKQR